MNNSQVISKLDGSEIAVIGIGCRFPGADTPEKFWNNLKDGVESIKPLSDEELRASGVSPDVIKNPNYVKMASVIDCFDKFDAAFFGYTAKEAELMDPQHRLFMECAWEALENAGYNPETYRGSIGVFGGAKTDTYLFNISSNRELLKSLDAFQIALGNDLGSLSTRISYKFDLRGPSYAIHTACSTSLVSVHLACQSLLVDECQMAIAGGVTVNVPHKVGYMYQLGGVVSPDGHCRAFDADANGTVFGNGVGIVILKRLEDAINDGDHIYAVIKGSAANNDGAKKASYTAPGVDGQTKVVMEALANSGVDPETITYVEAHGTGTNLGDPIEVLALTNAYGASTDKKGYCAIGSVKTNIGHLDAAAGISSLIKTILCIKNSMLPPTLHFKKPNPKIDFQNSPFFVNTELTEWKPKGFPKRAGVSSFGFGSTNAHVILEEAPELEKSGPSRPWQLLLLSARSKEALDRATSNLIEFFRNNPSINLADAAYTLKLGRKVFEHRRAIVCSDIADAIDTLENQNPRKVFSGSEQRTDKPVAFMFPGQGAQYINMALELYKSEKEFRESIDCCAELLKPHLGIDIRKVLFPDAGYEEAASEQLKQTCITQPVLFIIEYSLAKLLIGWGVRPQVMIGHSIGEYVAACISGVYSLEDAIKLVAARGRLMQSMPAGAMLSVALSEEKVKQYINETISIAAVNAPELCVVAGPSEEIGNLEKRLAENKVQAKRLVTSHAFHSHMMEPAMEQFKELFVDIKLNPPAIPYLSNVTGTWIRNEEATDPEYWAKHLRQAVLFSDGIQEIMKDESRVLLEVGPGQTLGTLAGQHNNNGEKRTVLSTLRHPNDKISDMAFFMGALGKLWIAGVSVKWSRFYAGEKRLRVPLPAYPFEHERYWIDAADQVFEGASKNTGKKQEVKDWFYIPVWEKTALKAEKPRFNIGESWLIFNDKEGIGNRISTILKENGQSVITVTAGERFEKSDNEKYMINPNKKEDYDLFIEDILKYERLPANIVHLWTVSEPDGEAGETELFNEQQNMGYYSLIYLTQALLNKKSMHPLQIWVVSNGVFAVSGNEKLYPEKSTILGPCKVIPQEHNNIACRFIDIDNCNNITEIADNLIREFSLSGNDCIMAYRGRERWVQNYEYKQLNINREKENRLRKNGVYLITGGMGSIGLKMAEYMARTAQAKMVLLGRSGLPERDEWENWLVSHEETDSTGIKIKKIIELEKMGSEVLIAKADVGDYSQMTQIIAEITDKFGCINGVVHAAGLTGEGSYSAAQNTGVIESQRHFNARVYGLYILEKVLEGVNLDFFMITSSLSAILGGLWNTAYSASNIFLDAFANRKRADGKSGWTSVNWDSWHYKEENVQEAALGDTLAQYAISPAEGTEAINYLFSNELPPQVVVSTGDLHERIEQWVKVRPLSQNDSEKGAAVSGGKVPGISDLNDLTARIASIWKNVLGTKKLSPDDNFFDIGGNSFSGLQVISDINAELDVRITPVTLYEAPTVAALADYLSPEVLKKTKETEDRANEKAGSFGGKQDIAVIGIGLRFPGAKNAEEFWENLINGVESIEFYTDEELEKAGVQRELLKDPNYVKAKPAVNNVDMFDAAFFGYTPREAELMDPQQRIFLECAWEALERAGYDPEKYEGSIGVFAGTSISTYLLGMYRNPEAAKSVGSLQAIIGNDKDSLTTSVSYKLNLKGPSISVQTYCSTSLVAVHTACRSLMNGDCHMALAGGSSINVPEKRGYMYQDGNILSPDGHCRAFDANANGTLFGDGVGVVVLKRMEDALSDGDTVLAVIKGSAINNDGSLKVGYTAPSVDGQSKVVAQALRNSGVEAGTIGYVEAHGTATPMGDPIEVTALTKAFNETTDKKGYCILGSVKTNVGHLDRAAGVAGLIKTVMALKNRKIPPTLHFKTPNPNIDFENSPFYVSSELLDWNTGEGPRRAGVNALGFGGTNVHVVLEEAPEIAGTEARRAYQLLVLSARTPSALDTMTSNLAQYLRNNPSINLADVSYTLQIGRRDFNHRRIAVCSSTEDAVDILTSLDSKKVMDSIVEPEAKQVVFMFPGQGSQYVNMGLELYKTEAVFREQVDYACGFLKSHAGIDLISIMYPQGDNTEEAAAMLARTRYTQPLLFIIEYAAAKLLISLGVVPQAMIGHSVGEYVAACLAGVLSIEDALTLVSERGRMIQELPGGTMLGVPMSEKEILPLLGDSLSLAAINAPNQCVVSGPNPEIQNLAKQLSYKGVECRQLHTSHAFHSKMMDPILESFTALVSKTKLSSPKIPYISCVTGTWIRNEEAVSPSYWANHLRQAVRFSDGIKEIMAQPASVLVEVGPGQTLSSLAKRHLPNASERVIVSTIRHPDDQQSDISYFLRGLGRLWLGGVCPDWTSLYKDEKRCRIILPTYPFERKRYWIDIREQSCDTQLRKRPDDGKEWIYTPSWRRAGQLRTFKTGTLNGKNEKWLVFTDDSGLGSILSEKLCREGQEIIKVRHGEAYEKISDYEYTINPWNEGDYGRLAFNLKISGSLPETVLHLWSCSANKLKETDPDYFKWNQTMGLYSIIRLVRALDKAEYKKDLKIWTVTCDAQQVSGDEELCPEKAMPAALCKTLTQEYPQIVCCNLDISSAQKDMNKLADYLISEMTVSDVQLITAIRGNYKWLPDAGVLEQSAAVSKNAEIRKNGTYLITGGFEGIGFEIAQYLANEAKAKLVFPVPFEIPSRDNWDNYLSSGTNPTESETEAYASNALLSSRLETDLSGELKEIALCYKENEEISFEKTPEGLEEGLDRLCSCYVLKYLSGKLDINKGSSYSIDCLKDKLKVIDKFHKFLGYMLDILCEDAIISITGDKVKFLKGPEEIRSLSELKQELVALYPGFSGGIAALDRCSQYYDRLMSGEAEAVDVLYDQEGKNILKPVNEIQDRYSNVRQQRFFAGELIRHIRSKCSGRPLKILEIGTGDGTLTWELLSRLKDFNIEYHYAAASKNLTTELEKKAVLDGIGPVKFGVLNLMREPEEQGYALYDYDLVIGIDSVHTAAFASVALTNLRKLLVPQGALILIEATRTQRWVNMIWGVVDGWWEYSDIEVRGNSPLVNVETWSELGLRAGYDKITLYPEDKEEASYTDHSMIIMQQSGSLTADYKEWAAKGAMTRKQWVQESIRKLIELEKSGAAVFAAYADISCEESMGALIDSAQKEFGPLNGVIHAAGFQDKKCTVLIRDMDEKTCEEYFDVRVHGIKVLDRLLKNRRLDFAVSMSSITPISGGRRFTMDAAACMFLDAFSSRSSTREGIVWTNISWDFRDGGETLSASQSGSSQVIIGTSEGLNAFKIAVSNEGQAQLIISRDDIKYLVEQKNKPSSLKGEELPQGEHMGALYERPELDNDYVAPRNETESTIMKIWQEVLGIGEIGVNDNFFDLGGDSLQATQLNSRIRSIFSVDLPIQEFFKSPTIMETAASVEQMKAEEDIQLEQEIMKMLEGLTDEEIEAELLKRMKNQ